MSSLELGQQSLNVNSESVESLSTSLEVPFKASPHFEWMRTYRCEYGYKWSNKDYNSCTRDVYRKNQKPGLFRKLIAPIIPYTTQKSTTLTWFTRRPTKASPGKGENFKPNEVPHHKAGESPEHARVGELSGDWAANRASNPYDIKNLKHYTEPPDLQIE